MAKLLADYRTRLDQMLKEQAGDLIQGDKDSAIENAVKEHSKYRPRVRINDFGGDSVAFDFALTGAGAPAGYEVGFSTILSVEYPADDRQPSMLEDEDWTIYAAATEAPKLRLFTDTPQTGKKVRINYIARHTVDATTGTIPDGDFEAVNHLAAKYALLSLMNRYLQNTEPTLGADVVDHKSKADYARTNANKEEAEYFQHMGIKPGEVPAGMAFKDYDVNFPWGEDRLTHGRRWR